jgi:hypothetical protein
MNIFIDDHRLILEKLIAAKIDFMLIGGYAVNIHGYNRTTADLDIWIKPSNENKLFLMDVLLELGFSEEGVNTIRSWDFEKPQIFSIFPQPFVTEFMTHISGVKYENAIKNVVFIDIDGIALPIIHINNLIANKKASGRTKDILDAEQLEKILNLR